MKYKTRIFPEGDGYVGQAILNEEVVYTTNVLKDSVMVTRELSTYIANANKSLPQPQPSAPVKRRQVIEPNPNNEHLPQAVNSPSPFYQKSEKLEIVSDFEPPPPRKCCGRR